MLGTVKSLNNLKMRMKRFLLIAVMMTIVGNSLHVTCLFVI